VRLTPSFREKVWGKRRLGPFFPDANTSIGEVWFTADRDLPLLVKFLYTDERLSVQVHPDGPRGKTEMWHVVHAEPGAALALGFREPITRERLREAALSGEIEGLLNWIPVRAGEMFFVPAHTVHAIGAGLVLCEIQQNSDVTYRLYDYGRPRELHLEQALPICDLGVHPGRVDGTVVRCPYFQTELLNVKGEFPAQPEECQMWVVLEGTGVMGAERFRAGEVWLLDRVATGIRVDGTARFLRTYVPREGTPSVAPRR
jgi:mannose-6-phosphate isomerase